MNNIHASYLKEMGITQWVSRDSASDSTAISDQSVQEPTSSMANATPRSHWWFFGTKPQGETQLLFQNIIKVLGLKSSEWSWNLPGDNLSQLKSPGGGVPVVAVAFGGPAAQKITGERDPLPQLRETILALNTGNDDEIPVIATQDLAQVVAAAKEKAQLWQDLLLAKSVLQNT